MRRMGATGKSVNAMSFLNTEEIETEIAQPQYTVLPDKLNTMTGTLDNDLDVKYYTFTAVRGQKVMIHELGRTSANSPWKIEYKTDKD
ncbi:MULTISPECIES: hypothetical protein [unclassified Pseudomonas]|uniref:hypothetical protein n=1 Tax=unclassified Pseudomonas TaxID=196821 RepID=UPI002AC98CA9|nr:MULTISPECIES: hypothetical protein [unclassified Pseudomonas]MEB0042006.1 hypothetical protein [Pseudomonas sp. MH10]MEB0078167.1 hypothetical protein [Pseudomonas sp. MH10out]MEB0093445.1 hypothetical protein [Pseudomonas sp. CCI4.2]MEB0102221.1 hypothetical protein [Pseudomonas sp. CCI3.2]MEB0121429.1 hypothetical protein [Pseudomonas sp. CCI1.2]